MPEEIQLTKTIKWIDFALFPQSVMLANGYSYEELLAKFGKRFPTWVKPLEEHKKLFDTCWGFVHRHQWTDKNGVKKCHYWLIIKDPFDFSDEAMCNLAHEVLHVVQFVLADKINRDDEVEFEAYFHTYLMTECLKALRAPVKIK